MRTWPVRVARNVERSTNHLSFDPDAKRLQFEPLYLTYGNVDRTEIEKLASPMDLTKSPLSRAK